MLRLDGSTSVASKTFWEAEDGPGRHGGAAADDTSPQERLLGLFAVAARWVAIQLMVHTVFPHGARRRKRGMDKVVLGMLLRQSADGFQGHEAEYRRLAAQALGEACRTSSRSHPGRGRTCSPGWRTPWTSSPPRLQLGTVG